MKRAISPALLRASYFLFINNNNNYYRHLVSNASHTRRKRRDKYPELIRNLSFSHKKKPGKAWIAIERVENSLPLHTCFFFFQYQEKVSHKLNTVKLQCNYNLLLVYYLMSIAIKLEFSFKLSALSLFFFSISGHMTSKEPLPTESFRARNTAKSVALIFSGNMQVCCFPPEQSRSVQNSPLSLHLLPKVSLQQHFSIYLLSLVPRVFLFPSQKASGDGKRTERREREKLRVMFSQPFMINITILY